MQVKGEIVFPNNIRDLRLRKRMTQAQLARRMDPPVVESTISKMENGERRLSNLQLADLASIFDCRPDEIPVMNGRDKSTEVRRWQSAQQEVIRHSVESGAAAIGYVLAQLRKKHGKTMQQVASAIGMTISVYHRVEMASRMIQGEEIERLAKVYGMSATKLIGMFERRTRENLQQLQKGVPPEQLLPRAPRALLKDDAKWGRLGALERYAMRRSIRYVGTSNKNPALPVYGKLEVRKKDGSRHFAIDREVMVDQIAIGDVVHPNDDCFLVRNFSSRLGFLLRPGALAYVDPETPVTMGDVCFVIRRDGTADAAIIIGDGIGPLRLKLYNPEEEIPIEDAGVAAVFRVGMVIFP